MIAVYLLFNGVILQKNWLWFCIYKHYECPRVYEIFRKTSNNNRSVTFVTHQRQLWHIHHHFNYLDSLFICFHNIKSNGTIEIREYATIYIEICWRMDAIELETKFCHTDEWNERKLNSWNRNWKSKTNEQTNEINEQITFKLCTDKCYIHPS